MSEKGETVAERKRCVYGIRVVRVGECRKVSDALLSGDYGAAKPTSLLICLGLSMRSLRHL